MRLISTRDPNRREYSFEEALFQGLAPDGGLFVPTRVIPLPPADLEPLRGAPFQTTAVRLVTHLLGDELPAALIEAVVGRALDFPVPLTQIRPDEYTLELFHGPTFAFKDVGARFMAHMMAALRPGASEPRTVLAATSGDTGGAVAHAFLGLPGVRVVVVYPRGQVSPIQEAQFTTLGANVLAVGVRGTFDDCQRIVKEAFTDSELSGRHRLTSANSINVGRLIPQALYYAHAWASLPTSNGPPMFAVPSGNFGNLVAGLLAQSAGVPVSRFIAATNANRSVPDYLKTGVFSGRASIPTLSNAMDVGDPSNFERMRHFFGDEVSRARSALSASAWSDEETERCIQDTYRQTGRVLDPHTAVGLLGLREEMGTAGHSRDPALRPHGTPGVVLATAHPAKFVETVEPLVGEPVPLPKGLADSLARARGGEARSLEIPPELEALSEVLR